MVLLGSTGSIGVNTLEIAKKFDIDVEILVAGNNIGLLNKQIAIHKPSIVVVASADDAEKVEASRVYTGEEGILRALEESQSELVVNALVGFLGLRPTLKAVELGKRIALANKESLVAGGAFIDTSRIQPIDSEHFGLWYLLQESKPVERMLITASGGAFRDWPIQKLQNATLEDALKHPNWSMGQKITIDSASMMNKLFELLEARWLFGEGEYDALIETKSLIHALIDFKDGSTTAHFAHANMQLPIAYAVRGEVDRQILKPVNLIEVGGMEFREITSERYPIWQIKDEIMRNPKRGVIVNAANEAAIEKFVAGEIGFMEIARTIIDAYERFNTEPQSIDDVFALDGEVRDYYRKAL
jgi:1-deoxy-D-xylulose-5-phosphate reductoisomerase